MQQVDEEWEEEECKNEEEEEESVLNDDFDETFRSEQPSVEGVKIRTTSSTSPTSFAGVSVTTPDTSRGKDLMIVENRPDPDSD